VFEKQKYFAVMREEDGFYYRSEIQNVSWKKIAQWLRQNANGVFDMKQLQKNADLENQSFIEEKHLSRGFFAYAAKVEFTIGRMENWKVEHAKLSEIVKQKSDASLAQWNNHWNPPRNLNITIGVE
jgi:hypothetical protein